MWIGVAATSLQTEGAGPRSDWWAWETEGHAPRSGDGNGFGTGFADDMALYAQLGHSHVRVGVEWARIEPAQGKLDHDELDRYTDVLAAARHAGLEPVVTLAATTLPGWFHDDEGGFVDDRARTRHWVGHVERCAEAFETLAAGWVGVDDPIGWAIRAYGIGTRPPGRTDPVRAIEAVEAMLDADRLAARILAAGPSPVLSSFGLPTVLPVGPGAGPHARWWDDLLWKSWIGAVRDGELAIPGRAVRPRPEWVDTYDLIGFSHSHPLGVDAEGNFCPAPAGGVPDGSGFVPTPPELGEALRRLGDELPGQQLVITGTGVTTDDDDRRDGVLADVAHQVDLAVDDGVALTGWFHDTGVDGYEPGGGFDHRRGIIDRDRNIKPSAARVTRRIDPPDPDSDVDPDHDRDPDTDREGADGWDQSVRR